MSTFSVSDRFAVADELFLIGHHEYTGKRHAGDEVFGLGLAAAVLIELGWQRAIALEEGAVLVRTTPTFTGDPVLDHVLGKVAAQEPVTHPAASWIDYLREDLYLLVAERLKRQAVIEEVQRGVLSRQSRLVAVNPFTAARPRSLMLGVLRDPPGRRQPPADAHYAVLAGLVAAMEMWEAIPTVGADEAAHNSALLLDRMHPAEQAIIKGVSTTKAALARRVRR